MTDNTSSLDSKIAAHVQHAYDNAAAFRARMDAAGLTPADIQNRDDLKKLPVFSKDGIIARQQADPPFGGMLAVPMSEVTHIFMSPGPIYEPAGQDAPEMREIAATAYKAAGFTADDVVLNGMSYHLVPAGMLLDRALTSIGCTVFPGGIGNSDLQLKVMQDIGATAYTGTPSFLALLINKANEMGLDFKTHFNIKRALTTAEPLFAPTRQLFIDNGVEVVCNAYATAEIGFIGINLDGGMAMQLLEMPVVQIVDPDTGEEVGPGMAGEVVVTNFDETYPLIRIGLGDLAVNMDPNPGGSMQQERAIVLVGRTGDAVKVRGMFVHPNQVNFAAQQVPGIQKVQGVVTQTDSRDQLTIRATLADGVEGSAPLGEGLKQAITAVARVKVDTVEFVDEIPAEAPGMVDERDWSA